MQLVANYIGGTIVYTIPATFTAKGKRYQLISGTSWGRKLEETTYTFKDDEGNYFSAKYNELVKKLLNEKP